MWDRDDNPQYVMGENTRLKSNQNKYGLGLTVSYDNESHRPVGSVCHGGAGNTFFSLNYEANQQILNFPKHKLDAPILKPEKLTRYFF